MYLFAEKNLVLIHLCHFNIINHWLLTLSTQECAHLAINDVCSEGKEYKNSSFMPFSKVCVDKLEK